MSIPDEDLRVAIANSGYNSITISATKTLDNLTFFTFDGIEHWKHVSESIRRRPPAQ